MTDYRRIDGARKRAFKIPAAIPEKFSTAISLSALLYLTDQSGNYLTDQSGNRLISGSIVGNPRVIHAQKRTFRIRAEVNNG